MKFRQHIRVFGYPDALKHVIPFSQPSKINIEGVGVVNLMSTIKGDKFRKILDEHDIKYTNESRTTVTRVRYISCGAGKGVNQAIRGRLYRGDVLYTIESDDERDILDKTEFVLKELRDLHVEHEEVCKWFCSTPPKPKAIVRSKKSKSKEMNTILNEHKQLKNSVEDLKSKVFDLELKPLKRAAEDDMKVRKGILQ